MIAKAHPSYQKAGISGELEHPLMLLTPHLERQYDQILIAPLRDKVDQVPM